MITSPSIPTSRRVRDLFPSLAAACRSATGTVYLDNAGGSQMPGVVADAMHRYMTTSFVQIGADYDASVRATATVRAAHEFLKTFVGGGAKSEVIIGPSTSQLCRMLADCSAQILKPGDEIILCETSHESNFGPWHRLESAGVAVKVWKINPKNPDANSDERMRDLRALLSPRTKVVAFPQVSNILGQAVDVARITALAHEVGARVVCDGVASAPHAPIDVAAWGVDWYVYSTYKVFGPHAAVLAGTHDAMAQLTGPNHAFIPREEWPRKFELGGANHESCAGILALDEYMRVFLGEGEDAIAPTDPGRAFSRARAERAFRAFGALEEPLTAAVLDFLRGREDVRIIGPSHAGPDRVATISFVSTRGKSSREIALACNQRGLGVRHGHFYAFRLCRALGLDPADGVVRVSLAHYNTMEEVERLLGVLREVL